MHDSAPLPRLRPAQLIALDVLAAVLYPLITVTGGAQPGVRMPVWAQLVIAVAIGAPLAVRRVWPRTVFCLVFGMSVLTMVPGMLREPFLAAGFALYTVALTEPRRRWVPTRAIGAASVIGVLLLALAGTRPPWPGQAMLAVTGVLILGGAWSLGRDMREWRMHATRMAEQHAERAVTEERLRIARELHDVVAHSMGVITVKAGVANHLLRTSGTSDDAADALRHIETASRTALTELRHMLGMLRSTVDTTGASGELRPPPGLAALPELVDRASIAGVRVELDVRGTERLPEGVDLAVYRIVQEALTNVAKHAAPARCAVTVEADGSQVRIEVLDDGQRREAPAPSGGSGLIGMRERALMYHGEFTAGPRPEGGFAVSARLRYEPETI